MKGTPSLASQAHKEKNEQFGLASSPLSESYLHIQVISFVSFEKLAHPPAHVQILRPKTNQGTTRCPPGKDRLHALSWLAAKRDCRKIWLDPSPNQPRP